MKVFYDHQIFSSQRHGGISRYFYELIKGVSQSPDLETAFFAGPYVSHIGIDDLKSVVDDFFGFRRPRLGPIWKKVAPLACIAAEHFLKRWSPDLYHPTNYAMVASPSGVKRILTIHDMIPERFPDLFRSGIVAEEKRRAIQAADAFLCVSECTRNDLIEFFPEVAGRTSVIYHGASLVPPSSGSSPKRDRPYFVYVGARNAYKNFDLLLEAFQQWLPSHPEAEILCVGGGRFSNAERKLISKRKLVDAVRQISATDESLAQLYLDALALIYPSLYEGFGIPVIEAMRCGCPVISSNTSSLPEAGGDAALYFNPHSVEELVHRMETVATDTRLREEMISRGKEHSSQFTWEKAVCETREQYDKLVSSASTLGFT